MATPGELALAPFGALYGAAVRARLALYRHGLLKPRDVGAPVLSVGNLTAGGTGKTPLVEWLARAVAREGLRACVLTRGYGRADESRRVVVSDGARVLADAREGGDEPRLLAESLVGVASVLSDADRVSAALWARENLCAEAFVLDDGFQHLRIRRDLDVVTLDATSPWGGGRLLPRGRLREPPSGLRRAHCVVLTRVELTDDAARLRAEVEEACGGSVPVLTSRVRTTGVRPLAAEAPVVDESRGAFKDARRAAPQPVAAFCALGNPRAFFRHLRNDGHVLCQERAFPDHHALTQAEADELSSTARSHGARCLLTTAKDAVKLRGLKFGLPVFVSEMEIELEDEGVLTGMLRRALSTRREVAGPRG